MQSRVIVFSTKGSSCTAGCAVSHRRHFRLSGPVGADLQKPKDFNQTFIAGALCDKGLFSSFCPRGHPNPTSTKSGGMNMDYIGYIIAGVVLLLGIVLLVCGYLKAPPDTA